MSLTPVPSGIPWRQFDVKTSGHFRVLEVRPPKDPDPNERIQAQGAHAGNREGGMGDYHEMDWYRRNVFDKKA